MPLFNIFTWNGDKSNIAGQTESLEKANEVAERMTSNLRNTTVESTGNGMETYQGYDKKTGLLSGASVFLKDQIFNRLNIKK